MRINNGDKSRNSKVMQTGADGLIASGLDLLQGKRIGLITNPTAVVGNRSLIDFLTEQTDLAPAVLFGPEHGVRMHAAAGEKITDGRDFVTGIPIYSLFGKTKKPTPAMLAGIEVLVFDIQDVGARFYTYISTLGYAMQAAAEAEIHMVVLDRPNPLGGEHVEGPILQPDQQSFIGLYPIPIVHGLTVGEIARAIQRERWLPGLDSLKLEVIPMHGWSRNQTWNDLQREWIPPSPNLSDFATAQVYPGTCLFEGTVASEGRGTEIPFRFIGAPWANPQRLLHSLEMSTLQGVAFSPCQLTPHSIQGKAQNPKFENIPINGIEITITNTDIFSPVACGLHLLQAVLEQAPDPSTFFHKAGFARLAGNPRLSDALLQGIPIPDIIQSWAPGLENFREQRQPWLLY